MSLKQNEDTISHEAYVISSENDFINVRVIVKSACAECHVKGACNLSEVNEKIMQIPADGKSYKPNERVLVTMRTGQGHLAVFFAYILPLISILAGLIVGLQLFENEGIAAGLALLFALVYYTILYLNRNKLKSKFTYTITKLHLD